MPTYYDFLGILSSASQPEVNSAIDQQYDHWRRLTTHHEQETVENATRALRILEQIRNTLSDPISREKYNNSIGLGNQVGGLADPSAPPIVSSRIPVASPPPSGSMSNQHRIDAWLCPRCQTANVIGTRHCKNCGVAIGIDCPNCGRLTEASTKHCSNCGVNIQDALRKKKTLEDEQRKHREMQEAERIRVQREQERVNAEQASKKLVKQKQQSRRSCITWTFAIAGLLVCCVAASAIVPLALRKGQVANAPILQLPTVDPLIAAQMPKYSGENIAVVAQLQDVSDDRFQINFEVENLTQANITLAFLTSDVVVADDIGNVYPQQWDTQPVRDELDSSGYSKSRSYTLNLAGYLNPMAKSISISFPSLTGGEQPFQLTLPLITIDKASSSFETELNYVNDDSFNLQYKIINNSPYQFILRLNSSDFKITDDVGNVYQIDEYSLNENLAVDLDGGNQYSNYKQYGWDYEPGIDPKATALNIQITLMGQPFSSQILLPVSNEKIRYEAKVSYAYPDSNNFTVDVNVFNLGDVDFILRLDSNLTYITQGGITFTAQPESGRTCEIIRPGDSGRFQIRFDGNLQDQSNLLLTLPLVSGAVNIQVPVSPEK